MKRSWLALVGSALAFAGCASPSVESYRSEQPVLDLARYFNGELDAHGMFQDRSGKVVKRFTVRIEGRWSGNVGTLDEKFTYADGTTSRRVWRIEKLDENRYRGTADDVVGVAEGEAYGNALRWRYILRLPVDEKVYEVDFDDWMFLVDDTVMLNRSRMSKFGFTLGEVTLSFHKR